MSVTSVTSGPRGINSSDWNYRIRDDPEERAAIMECDGLPICTVPSALRLEDAEDWDSLFELPPLRDTWRN